MTADRIACVNPRCHRTAPADKHEPDTEIVCRSCWKLIPKALTDRYKALNRRERRLLGKVERRIDERSITLERVLHLQNSIESCRMRNWTQIRSYFRAPPAPEGLDNFLSEMGLD